MPRSATRIRHLRPDEGRPKGLHAIFADGGILRKLIAVASSRRRMIKTSKLTASKALKIGRNQNGRQSKCRGARRRGVWREENIYARKS